MEKWANTIRLMREVDGRTLQDIGAAFDWANKDSFWSSNILSPEKLRKQYDKLKVKANEANRPNQSKHSDGLSDSRRAILQARAERDGLSESFGSVVGSDGGDVVLISTIQQYNKKSQRRYIIKNALLYKPDAHYH